MSTKAIIDSVDRSRYDLDKDRYRIRILTKSTIMLEDIAQSGVEQQKCLTTSPK